MKPTKLILAALMALQSTPAVAGPLAPLIPVITAAMLKAAIVKIALMIAITVAVSMIQKAMKKKPRPPGMQTERKLYGGVVSRRFILGQYCTAGSEVTPPMSHGQVGKTPNAYLTYIVAVSDIEVESCFGTFLNGEFFALSALEDSPYGHSVGGKYGTNAFVKFYKGDQIAADPTLITNYGAYVRPWTADHIGKGVAYAMVTLVFNSDIFKGEPDIKFVIFGIRLYDPRKDSTVGGTGAHRWDIPTTWEITHNPIVMVYNILRGISFVDGTTWGGECEAADLPLANWVAGMNVCDEVVTTTTGTEPRYRAGYEVIVAEDEPQDIIEELLKACSGSISEIGGIYKVRVGPPALPVAFFTDDDFIVSRDQDFNPFPGIGHSINTVYASYPNPEEGWQAHDAPRMTDAAYVTEDDGQEIAANLNLPAVPYPIQVQRLMLGWLKDDRRWRQHSATFGHYAFILEPLDTIAWTSTRNGYTNKVFEIDNTSENLMTLNNATGLREVDPTDYDWNSTYQLPDPVVLPEWQLPDAQVVPNFFVEPYAILDNDSVERRPAIRCSWSVDGASDATGVQIQVREVTLDALIVDVTIGNQASGVAIIAEGILPATMYEVRAIYVVNRAVEWTAWLGVLTDPIYLSDLDITIDLTDIDEVVTNFNNRNDRISTPILDCTVPGGGAAVDHSINANGGIDMSFEWLWAGVNAEIDGFEVMLYRSTSSTAYVPGSTPAAEERILVQGNIRAYIIYGLPAENYYTWAVRAFRVVDQDVDADQIMYSPNWVKSLYITGINKEDPYHPKTAIPASGNITTTVGNVAAADVATGINNFNARNDRITAAPVDPVIATDFTAVDHVVNPNGSVDISFEWSWTGDENDIDYFSIMVMSRTSSATYTIGSTPLAELKYNIPPNCRAFILQGVPPHTTVSGVMTKLYYTFYVTAVRVVDPDIPGQVDSLLKSANRKPTTTTTIEKENPYCPADANPASGDITSTVGGVAAGSITTAVSNFNGRNDRNATAPVDPTIVTTGAAIDHTVNSDGSVDISFEWLWGGVEVDIDGFEVMVLSRTSSTAYVVGATPQAEFVVRVPPNKRAFILQGVPPHIVSGGVSTKLHFTFAVRAWRGVDPDVTGPSISNGVARSAWVQPSAVGPPKENPYCPLDADPASGDIQTTIDGVPSTIISGTIDPTTGNILTGKVITSSIAVGAVTSSMLASNVGTLVISSTDGWYNIISQGTPLNVNADVQAEIELLWFVTVTSPATGALFEWEYEITRTATSTPAHTPIVSDNFKARLRYDGPAGAGTIQLPIQSLTHILDLGAQGSGNQYFHLFARVNTVGPSISYQWRRKLKTRNLNRVT